MGRPRKAEGVLAAGLSRLTAEPQLADAIRAEAVLRGIKLSTALREMLTAYQQVRGGQLVLVESAPKTIIDPPTPREAPPAPAPARRRAPPRPIDPPTPPVEAPPRVSSPTMPSPALEPRPAPPTGPTSPGVAPVTYAQETFDAALARRGLEPCVLTTATQAALIEIWDTAKRDARTFERWIEVYLDEGPVDPSPTAMLMQLYVVIGRAG